MSVDVVRLSDQDHALLCARFREHANSQRRMRQALHDAGAGRALARIEALRQIERRFDVDLGALCHRWAKRTDDATHPLERQVMDYVATRHDHAGGWALDVSLDRLRALRELMEGRLVGERE